MSGRFSIFVEIKHKKLVQHSMELSFKNLPFVPEAGQVIYVESSYDEKINKYIQENYEWLVKEYGKCGFSFCYLPLLAKETIR